MDRTDEVLTFLDTYMNKELFSKTNNGSDAFDIIVTARKAKNGEKFIALFDKGIFPVTEVPLRQTRHYAIFSPSILVAMQMRWMPCSDNQSFIGINGIVKITELPP
ncbi:hypothetical protein OM428_06350 [Enterococcus gallinarum]|nr:hypothetical protein [Enterococcus gallinarum]MCW3744610.1 hypothetical protein [Enterococcus gallinarum]